jgi:hypothetical protein
MFKLADGREHLYQWDIDRQVIIDDPSIVEVHFCNRTDDCSLVTEVVDGRANVPNILLQSSFDIRVFAYDGKATMHDKKFNVIARTKPADYTYTETEIKSYAYLEKKLNEIEEQGWSDEIVERSINEYMYQNPLSMYDDGQGNVFIESVRNGQEVKF